MIFYHFTDLEALIGSEGRDEFVVAPYLSPEKTFALSPAPTSTWRLLSVRLTVMASLPPVSPIF
jgi:hypothetical protein